MRQSIKKQQGHAALLFALIIPAMWGFFTIAIDGSRAIQTKARLGDATEAAALALAAKNSTNLTQNKALAEDYVEAYLPDVDISIPKVSRTECRVSDGRECEGASRYAQYDIDVSIKQDPWLPVGNDFVGFKDTYEVTHASTARKYQGDSIDIAFVMDYSGSMNDRWQGKPKYKHVRDIINDVLDELEEYQGIQEINNKVALVPYAEYTARPSDSMRCPKWPYYSPTRFVDYLYYKQDHWGRTSLDAKKTVDNWQTDRSTDPNMVCDRDSYDDYYLSYKNVPFTDTFNQLRRDMQSFRSGGSTASYQGIIKAAQLFDQLDDPNPRQLMVILSDGDDTNGNNGPLSYYDPIPTKALVNANLCEDIKATLNSRRTQDNRPVTFQFALIGFDYNVNKNPLTECIGTENVYDAANPDELLDIILNLISEEIGHLS
ncbi:TadE/TadG family type IV pilus assembly protein [Vibrio brasiliensis]|uniref:TadE/TadG family type IV pilus assembly protein n=1 Tax=Vibrio brasiliensis TaxID=170652 RepID=UPI001EFCBABD|nr:pilus assembly protein TadG-related protein [Vibrio brasiliensis]MCG9724191.1 pilus assembly protein TadG-related protein [Vibrio brasiliensis]